MGFFDSFSEICEAVADLGRDLRDLHEYATVGFVEEVIKDNGPYKTSYEKQDEADAIISRENRRLRNASDELNGMIDALNSKIQRLDDKKRRLLKGISGCSSNPIVRYKASGYSCYTGRDETCGLADFMDNIGLGNTLIGMNNRISSSNQYLEDAKCYRSQCQAKLAQINNAKMRVSTIDSLLSEEERLLDALERSMATKRPCKYAAIADQLHQLIAEHVTDSSGASNGRYADAVRALDKLCAQL